MNALFVAKKPAGISSNHFLSSLKRKYGEKKAGFSGTLDPFASGVLVVAFGEKTKFFRFLQKSPKIYRATLWFGAISQSGDNENIEKVTNLAPFDMEILTQTIQNLKGEISYIPPQFSAKKIDGIRAYKLARNGISVNLKTQSMNVYECKILSYSHPFLSFEISLSEGGYVRSYAQILCEKLGVCGTLSALERIKEGKFRYENEKFLDPFEYLNIEQNFYSGDENDVLLGKKLNFEKFQFQNDGIYFLKFENFASIVNIENSEVKYLWNRIKI